MYLSLNKAAKEAGVSKSTLSEALNNGLLTANKDARGRWEIDPAALFQVFPKTTPNEQPEPLPNSDPNTENRIEIAQLRAELEAEKRMTERLTHDVDDLRRRLDQEGEDRRATQARLEDLRDKMAAAPTQEAEKSPSGGLFGFLRGKGRAEA